MKEPSNEQEALFAAAMRLQETADQLLEESGLIPLLGQFGEACPTGSYRYRLMMDPDIDLHVLGSPASKENATAVLVALIQQGFWRGFYFKDFHQFPRADVPQGHYIGLKADFGGYRWKVDLWHLSKWHLANVDYDRRLTQPLPEEARRLILAIKAARTTHHWNIGSVIIYDAVLEGQVRSVEEFALRFVPNG